MSEFAQHAVFTVVGRRTPFIDGGGKVTGRARYIADLDVPGAVWAVLLRSPYPHADIVDIDTSAALAVPGVRGIVTHHDAPKTPIEGGEESGDAPVYVMEPRLRHVGDEVAAIAADTVAIAQEAARLISVTYRQLPAVFDPEEALLDGAPQVRPSGNLAGGKPIVLARGDTAAGMAEADLVVEETYTTPFTSALPLEPRGCLAAWDGDHLTVWKSGRNVHGDRASLARVLGMRLNQVRVVTPGAVGGSFGNKDESRLQYITALLAKKAGRPVKLCYDLSEELRFGRWRHPSKITVRMGVKRDGAITAIESRCIMNTGPYVPGVNVCRRAGHGLTYLYKCRNVRFEGLVVYTNTPVPGSYRALGSPQGHFALESHVDLVAEKLGMDPLEFRRKNQVGPEGQPGEPYKPTGRLIPPQPVAGGIPFSSNALAQCFDEGAAAVGWQPTVGPRTALATDGLLYGTGVGACIYQTGQMPSSAIVRVNADATAEVLMGTLDVGQGSNTVLTIMAAETLGLPLDRVSGYFADAETTPFAHATAGSTTTFSSGMAVREAALDARRQLLDAAADILEAPVDALDIENGVIFAPEAPSRRLTIQEAMRNKAPRHIIGQADVQAGSTTSIVNSFAAHFVQVAVDPETGQVRVLRYVAAHDCGQPINLMAVEGQIEGGVLQGFGYALTEDLQVNPDDGTPSVANIDTFKLPTPADVPERFDVLVVDSFDPVGPFGAKAVGEVPVAPVAAAIANAVYDATGVRIRDLPITPEKVLRGLRALQG